MDDLGSLSRVTSILDTVRITTRRSADLVLRFGVTLKGGWIVTVEGDGEVVRMHKLLLSNRFKDLFKHVTEQQAQVQHDNLVADCRAELAVKRIYHLPKQPEGYDLEGWLTDHISDDYHLFQTIEAIGFYRENDEVIWKLSPFCRY